MKQTQTFAQRFPFYMTAETSARTIEIGRASVRIRADVTDYCAAMKKASAIVRDFGDVAGPIFSSPFQCCDGVVPTGHACRRCGAEQGAAS